VRHNQLFPPHPEEHRKAMRLEDEAGAAPGGLMVSGDAKESIAGDGAPRLLTMRKPDALRN